MTISSLTGKMPTLVDYLGTDKASTYTGAFSTGSNSTTLDLASLLGIGDTVSLSSSAQQISTGDADGGAAAKAEAQDFFLDFFQKNDVDLDNLSLEARKFMVGIADMAENMGAVTHDTTMDGLTKKYEKGQRESYTLQGANERVSFTIQYKDGKAESLTVLELRNGTSSSAVISLSKDSDGKAVSADITRMEKQYSPKGNLLATLAGDPLSVAFYDEA